MPAQIVPIRELADAVIVRRARLKTFLRVARILKDSGNSVEGDGS
jgi:hypothetical protein